MDESHPPSRQKILIIRFSSMGDIVLTSPVTRAIYQQCPNAEIHYLTRKGFENLLQYDEHISNIHVFNGDMCTLVDRLKLEKFDFAVDLQHNFRSWRLLSSLRVPYATFPKLNFRKWLRVCFKIDLLPRVHIVQRYFRAALPLGVHDDGKGLYLRVPDSETFNTKVCPASFEDGFVAVVLGATYFTKRIPPHKIIEIARLLHKPIFLLGGQDVTQQGEDIARELGSRAYNGCGKLNLYQSASVIQQANCVLAADTGLMHIAAALQKPVATLWGNTIPEFGMYPYMPEKTDLYRQFEVPHLKCRPCSKLGFRHCPCGHFNCMEQQVSMDIAQWINLF
ncbi:MAG: glycosyltransferase family 9 protein [Bacteroidales bacterium]|jgi:ADP-heptose:LPS heptosyltransferase|nr:glycosyltransferase family 9 protein [Bacteroidales bacterium]